MGNYCHNLSVLSSHGYFEYSRTILDKRKATKEEVYTYNCVHPEKDDRRSFGLNRKKNGKRQDEKEATLDKEVKNMGC